MLRAAQSEDLHSVRWQDHQQEQNLQTTSKTKGELVFPIQRETVLEYRLLLLLTPRNVRGELFLLHCGLSVKTQDVSLEELETAGWFLTKLFMQSLNTSIMFLGSLHISDVGYMYELTPCTCGDRVSAST